MSEINSSSLAINPPEDEPFSSKSETIYLQKKTNRNKFNQKEKKRFLKPFTIKDKRKGCKSVIRPIKKKDQFQTKINTFFEKTFYKNVNIDNSLLDNGKINNLRKNSPLSLQEECNSYNKNGINNENKITKQNESSENEFERKLRIINNYSNYSKAIKNYEKEKINNDNNINAIMENKFFNLSEILLSMKIQHEFNKELNGITSETDRIIKIIFFFIKNGFNFPFRYFFYKCLINYGFPLVESFNSFYQKLLCDCINLNINLPSKMHIEFYTEYIFYLLIKDKISDAKNKLISDFFFNGENIDIIKNNLNFINFIKENNKNIRGYLQSYLESNYDKIFKQMDIKLNKQFPKSKPVLCRMLSNILTECEKSGYLNYKKFIEMDGIIFDSLRIKGPNNITFNLRKMISSKIFGHEYSDKKFNNLINDCLLRIFSNSKI